MEGGWLRRVAASCSRCSGPRCWCLRVSSDELLIRLKLPPYCRPSPLPLPLIPFREPTGAWRISTCAVTHARTHTDIHARTHRRFEFSPLATSAMSEFQSWGVSVEVWRDNNEVFLIWILIRFPYSQDAENSNIYPSRTECRLLNIETFLIHYFVSWSRALTALGATNIQAMRNSTTVFGNVSEKQLVQIDQQKKLPWLMWAMGNCKIGHCFMTWCRVVWVCHRANALFIN